MSPYRGQHLRFLAKITMYNYISNKKNIADGFNKFYSNIGMKTQQLVPNYNKHFTDLSYQLKCKYYLPMIPMSLLGIPVTSAISAQGPQPSLIIGDLGDLGPGTSAQSYYW